MPVESPSVQQYKWADPHVVRTPGPGESYNKYYSLVEVTSCAMALPVKEKIRMIHTLVDCLAKEVKDA